MEGSSKDSKFHFRLTKFEVYAAEPAKNIEEAVGK